MGKRHFLSELRGLISAEPCNTGRQQEVDLAKAMIACCLAAIHVFVECSTDEALDSYGVPYFFDSILGGPMAAPMFMFCMGVGLRYAHDHSPRHLFIRGVRLIAMGYLLNLCRYVIPSLLGYMITGDYDFYIIPLPYRFFGNDIWQFAGLANLFMALLIYLDMTPLATFNVGVITSAISMVFPDLDTHNEVLNVLLGHFIGVGGEGRIYSDFPLFIWFPIYAGGYVFGYYLIRVRDEERFYRMITVPSLIITLGFMSLEAYLGVGMMGGSGANVFYHMLLPEAFICILFVVGFIGVDYYILKYLPQWLISLIERISRSLMAVYFIQWVLVWWIVDFFIYVIRGDKYLDWPWGLLLGIVIGAVSVEFGIRVTESKGRYN